MPNVHRLTDINSGGGIITDIPQSTVFANNLLVSINGSMGTGHPPCGSPGGTPHCDHVWKTTDGATTVFIQNIPVNRMGDTDTCGHNRIAGSPDVFVG